MGFRERAKNWRDEFPEWVQALLGMFEGFRWDLNSEEEALRFFLDEIERIVRLLNARLRQIEGNDDSGS